MNVDQHMVDQIVASVLEQLQTQTPTLRESTSQPTTAQNSQPLLLTDSVLTEDLLHEKLNGNGTQQIEIGPKTVLTPTARDYLRKQNIHWTRLNGTPTAASMSSTVWKAFIVYTTECVKSVLEYANRSTAWRSELMGQTDEAATAAVSTLCRAEAAGVVIFTEHPHRAACRANRNPQVRAAVATDPQSVELAKQQLGPNLLCIDPSGKSYFELRNFLRTFTAEGPPHPPPDWPD